MSGGLGKKAKSSNWKGHSKRRCGIDGCKKRARHIINKIPYCKKHVQWENKN